MPDKSLENVQVASVLKKMKRADFARNVNRDDIVTGAAELGVPLEEHVSFTLEALRAARAELGL
jgi:predicted hydrolase (HD superfamily)